MDIKFAHNIHGVEIMYGYANNIGDREYTFSYSYKNIAERAEKIALAEQEYLKVVNNASR